MQVIPVDKAVAIIQDGDSILIGGSGGGHAVAESLIVALERQRVAVQNLDRRGQATSEMTRLLNEASDDLDVVLRGRFHHNFAAAEVILDRVAELLRQLEKLTAAGTR